MAASRAWPSGVTPSTRTENTACVPKTSSAPVAHSQAGRYSATSASIQQVPATDQSTEPIAPGRRCQPTSATTASAVATATTASARLIPPFRARGTSQPAAPSIPAQASTGITGCR